MSGRKSRSKGMRIERECVRILQDAGLAAEKVPLSGAAGGRYCGDVSVPVLGIDRVLEVKCRASGWKQAYAFLADNYGLVIRADREEPLMVMRLKDFAELAIIADGLRPRPPALPLEPDPRFIEQREELNRILASSKIIHEEPQGEET
jgi:hypothetical protein